MAPKSIDMFMWGYQPHFRSQFEHLMNGVLNALGVSDPGAQCLLVGARIPGRDTRYGVCIEPEDGKWKPDLFDGLLDLIENEFDKHPSQRIFYTDAPSMQDKPENIRRDSVRIAVQNMLENYDHVNDVRSFSGQPAPIAAYYVVPVLQLPAELFKRFRPLQEPISFDRFTGQPSLIHAAISKVLTEAHDELLRPDPGRVIGGRSKSPQEIIRRAAESFMHTPGIALSDKNFWSTNLFENFNVISSLMYEGKKGMGKLFLANPDGEAVNFLVRFANPVPLGQYRWSRKVLEMASPQTPVIADCKEIFGLGNVVSNADPWKDQSVFEVEFLDHHLWQLTCGDETMLISKYGTPSLPQEKFPKDRFLDTFQRLFQDSDETDVARVTTLLDAAISQRHGSMLIVASDAESEASRLGGQGTKVNPTTLTPDLYRCLSGVDGAVLVDPRGICYAIGVILDGHSSSECTPSRGARYNSGLRYIDSSNKPRLAIIVSDDRTVDIVPILLPRVKRSELERAVAQLEAPNSDRYHASARWLDQHRFYVNQDQCNRVNAALKRIHDEPMEAGEIRRRWSKFVPDARLDDRYFEDE